MTPFIFILASLAVFRLSYMVTQERGPGGVFERLRNLPDKKSATAEWLSCIFCFSMTASALVCVLCSLGGITQHYALWGITWLALSAVTVLIQHLIK